jgi:hypothetical protein
MEKLENRVIEMFRNNLRDFFTTLDTEEILLNPLYYNSCDSLNGNFTMDYFYENKIYNRCLRSGDGYSEDGIIIEKDEMNEARRIFDDIRREIIDEVLEIRWGEIDKGEIETVVKLNMEEIEEAILSQYNSAIPLSSSLKINDVYIDSRLDDYFRIDDDDYNSDEWRREDFTWPPFVYRWKDSEDFISEHPEDIEPYFSKERDFPMYVFNKTHLQIFEIAALLGYTKEIILGNDSYYFKNPEKAEK